MRVLAVDDEQLMMDMLVDRIHQARPQAEVLPFGSSRAQQQWLEDTRAPFDAAF